MKTRNIFLRLCVAGLTFAVGAAGVAEDNAPGATRISKARKPAASVEQAGFDDVLEDPVDTIRYNASKIPTPQPSFTSTSFRNASYHGGGSMFNQPPEGETYIIEDGDCDCRKCKKFRKKHRRDCDEWNDCDEDCDGHGCGGHSHGMLNYFACKFGCFIPTGHGGAGSPYFGHYARVYPQDVNHFDQRDGQLYSAQGYGIPVAVPLAPVVGHTYNYGWGIPSSRLTPISHPTP